MNIIYNTLQSTYNKKINMKYAYHFPKLLLQYKLKKKELNVLLFNTLQTFTIQ